MSETSQDYLRERRGFTGTRIRVKRDSVSGRPILYFVPTIAYRKHLLSAGTALARLPSMRPPPGAVTVTTSSDGTHVVGAVVKR